MKTNDNTKYQNYLEEVMQLAKARKEAFEHLLKALNAAENKEEINKKATQKLKNN